MIKADAARIIDPQSIEFVSPFRSLVSARETLLPKRVEEVAPDFGPAAIGRLFRAAIDRLNRKYFSQSAETPEDQPGAEEADADGPTVFRVVPDYGGWKLTEEGSEDPIASALTKAEVEAKARQLAEEHQGPCRIRIHDREGNFESEQDYELRI